MFLNCPHPHPGLRWLYIDFNSYFASVEQQCRPELRGRPVAVVPVETDATCAIAASYEAKAFGIKTGTPIWQARQLCPGLICVLAQHHRYVEIHHRIQEEVERHIPVSDVCSIDEVACRLMDNETAPQTAIAIAESIKAGLAARIGEHIRCSIGIAPNKYLAKVATDLQKPNGLTVLGESDLPHRLHTLSLRDLPGVGANMERRLWRAGIYTMKDLLAIPPKQLRAIWGSVWGERMWYLLRGLDIADEETTRSMIGHSHVLSPELRHPNQARHVARRLTIKATSRIRRLGYRASGFSLSVRIEKGPRVYMESMCEQANDSFTFLNLLHVMWREIILHSPYAQIKKISVTLFKLIADDALRQGSLFTGYDAKVEMAREKHERVSTAMDTLNHKFGRDTVLLGILPNQGKSFSGTKIAFTRIPDMEEFLE